jgi:GxxExxY protein
MIELRNQDLSGKIIKAFYKVYNDLGYGFLEKVYENALFLELKSMGFTCSKQHPIKVYYAGQSVGEYFADIIVNDLIIIEIKAAEGIAEEHEHQLINYLKATSIETGLLLNFGTVPQLKRKILTNDRKSAPSVAAKTAIGANP